MSVPEPTLKGRFNMWDMPDGGVHIAYIADGTDETRHLEIPGMAVRVARMAAEGNLSPARAMREMREMMSNGFAQP